MLTVILQLLGVIVFALGTLFLGRQLRKSPAKAIAERTSKICHALYWAGLAFPLGLGLLYPGLTNFDAVVKIESLPFRHAALVVGGVLLLGGIVLTIASNKSLVSVGNGAAAFKLTKKVVHSGIYDVIRNPMSLGYYLMCLGLGFVAGSTYFILYSLLAVVPAHIFYLVYFEELELELRFGDNYVQYRRQTPLLIPRIARSTE